MVDVGSGLGHDLTAFASRNPDRKMRLVNEDLPEVIAQAKEQKESLDSRIELVEQDFFKSQSVKGAKIVSVVSWIEKQTSS
jgi:tRNA1(Val) A37 N6-methylase TrmN6